MNKTVRISVAAAFLLIGINVQAQYSKPSNYNGLPTKTINPSDNAVSKFNNYMNSNPNGVKIKFKSGTHSINDRLKLKQNVHVLFENNVVINHTVHGILFDISNAGNNSIAGPTGKVRINGKTPTVSNPLNVKFKAVKVENSNNVLIKNLLIYDHYTQLCTVGTGTGAKNVTIENITAKGCGPGYGLYQCQAGVNVRVNNLDGEGGVTMRMEQAASGGEYVDNLVATNIKCRNGRSGVVCGPSNENGTFKVVGITTYGCNWGASSGDGKGIGSFTSCVIKNVTAHYGTKGQFKNNSSLVNGEAKNFIPDNLQSQASTLATSKGGANGKFSTGPSFGCIKKSTDGNFIVKYKGTNKREGFPSVYNNDPVIVESSEAQAIADNR